MVNHQNPIKPAKHTTSKTCSRDFISDYQNLELSRRVQESNSSAQPDRGDWLRSCLLSHSKTKRHEKRKNAKRKVYIHPKKPTHAIDKLLATNKICNFEHLMHHIRTSENLSDFYDLKICVTSNYSDAAGRCKHEVHSCMSQRKTCPRPDVSKFNKIGQTELVQLQLKELREIKKIKNRLEMLTYEIRNQGRISGGHVTRENTQNTYVPPLTFSEVDHAVSSVSSPSVFGWDIFTAQKMQTSEQFKPPYFQSSTNSFSNQESVLCMVKSEDTDAWCVSTRKAHGKERDKNRHKTKKFERTNKIKAEEQKWSKVKDDKAIFSLNEPVKKDSHYLYTSWNSEQNPSHLQEEKQRFKSKSLIKNDSHGDDEFHIYPKKDFLLDSSAEKNCEKIEKIETSEDTEALISKKYQEEKQRFKSKSLIKNDSPVNNEFHFCSDKDFLLNLSAEKNCEKIEKIETTEDTEAFVSKKYQDEKDEVVEISRKIINFEKMREPTVYNEIVHLSPPMLCTNYNNFNEKKYDEADTDEADTDEDDDSMKLSTDRSSDAVTSQLSELNKHDELLSSNLADTLLDNSLDDYASSAIHSPLDLENQDISPVSTFSFPPSKQVSPQVVDCEIIQRERSPDIPSPSALEKMRAMEVEREAALYEGWTDYCLQHYQQAALQAVLEEKTTSTFLDLRQQVPSPEILIQKDHSSTPKDTVIDVHSPTSNEKARYSSFPSFSNVFCRPSHPQFSLEETNSVSLGSRYSNDNTAMSYVSGTKLVPSLTANPRLSLGAQARLEA